MQEVPKKVFEDIKKNLEEFPIIKELFGSDWIDSQFEIKSLKELHPFFKSFYNKDFLEKISPKLILIKNKTDKIKRIIKKIKTNKDEDTIRSVLSEIEVLSFYYKKQNDDFKVEYEPILENLEKVPDIKLTIANKEYFAEIITILDDQYFREIGRIQNIIEDKINGLDDNPYGICFGTEADFVDEDIDDFIELIKSIINGHDSINFAETYYYSKNGKVVGYFIIGKTTNGKGGVASKMVGGLLNDAGRLKNKLLGEIKHFPEKVPIIIIVDLSYVIGDFLISDDVCGGQLVARIIPEASESFPATLNNSIFNHDKGKLISLVIGYRNHNYEDRVKYQNPNSPYPISDEAISQL